MSRWGAPTAVTLGIVAFLAFIARTMLDWRFVYVDYIRTTEIATTALAIAFYVVVSFVWVWALFSARDGRRSGMLTLIGLSAVLLVALGVATWVSFCRFPCQSAWPLGEGINTGGTIIGVVAIFVAWRARVTARR